METNATSTIVDVSPRRTGLPLRALARSRRAAWIVIVAADIGLLAWAAMAAFAPERLLGPGSAPTLLFRMYGLYGVAFSLLAITIAANAFRRGESWAWWALLVGNTITYVGAMAYDQMVRAVGPFELTEYLGLALVYGFLAITVPFQVPWATGSNRPQKGGA